MAVNRWIQSGNYRRSYREDQTIFATFSEEASLIIFVLLLLALPMTPWFSRAAFRVINLIFIYTTAVIGVNIVTGFAGQINIGQAAFFGIGAYVTAVLSRDLGGMLLTADGSLPFISVLLLLVASGIIAAALGAFVGLPSFRLKHLYLAIATLAFQIIFVWVVGALPWLQRGGTMRVPRIDFFGTIIRGSALLGPFFYYFGLVVLIIMALALRNLLRSKFGRALIAVRDNDRAADAMGINPGKTKVIAFALSGFYAGVAGSMFALYNGAIIVESFTLYLSIDLLAMAIVGGLGTLVGSLIGPAFLLILDPWVEQFADLVQRFFPASIDVGTAMRPTVFGLIIVLFLIFEPRGLANWWRLMRQYFWRFPFKF